MFIFDFLNMLRRFSFLLMCSNVFFVLCFLLLCFKFFDFSMFSDVF